MFENLEQAFFEYELEMEENICREPVCSDEDIEKSEYSISRVLIGQILAEDVTCFISMTYDEI